jgi:hypothetical protein
MSKLTPAEQAIADKLVAEHEADMARIRPLNDFEKAAADRLFGPDPANNDAAARNQRLSFEALYSEQITAAETELSGRSMTPPPIGPRPN